jgi:hypothetical protein
VTGPDGYLFQLFLHEILPESVTKAIFIDSDALWLSDPACTFSQRCLVTDVLVLWTQFELWDANQLIGAPTHPEWDPAFGRQPPVEEWRGAMALCSCVLMLNLKRMVSVIFSSLIIPAPGGFHGLSFLPRSHA